MMRNNGLLKWSLHKNKNGSNNGKNWIHPPDSLMSGHIAYLVKFLGVTDAEQPKGIDVVKDCIRKLKLDEEIRRAEGGKTPKAEVTISIDGVAVQEPKGKKVLHQFPLHQISYCADDKAEKKFFSFIAKDGDVHRCFVFSSEKLAEEITLTIGQAFDLAYRRFLESSGRELELKREIMVLQKRIVELENENTELRTKLSSSSSSCNNSDGKSIISSTSSSQDNMTADLLICPPVPPRGNASCSATNEIFADFAKTANEIEKKAHESKNMDGMIFDSEPDSKPRGAPDGIEAPPRISPPPKGKKSENHVNGTGNSSSSNADIFGSDPFFTSPDPFGMPDFSKSKGGNVNGSAGPTNVYGNNNGFSTQINGNPSPFANNALSGSGAISTNGMNNSFNINDMNNGSLPSSTQLSSKNYSNLTGLFANGEGAANAFTFQNNLTNTCKTQQQPQNIDNALQILDKKIEEMKIGFSRGIHNDDFPLESLDPLRQSS